MDMGDSHVLTPLDANLVATMGSRLNNVESLLLEGSKLRSIWGMKWNSTYVCFWCYALMLFLKIL